MTVWHTISIDTPYGLAVIDFERQHAGAWTVHITDAVVSISPRELAETLAAAFQKLPTQLPLARESQA